MLGSDHTDGERFDYAPTHQRPQAAHHSRRGNESPMVRSSSRQACSSTEPSLLRQKEELIRQQQQIEQCAPMSISEKTGKIDNLDRYTHANLSS